MGHVGHMWANHCINIAHMGNIWVNHESYMGHMGHVWFNHGLCMGHNYVGYVWVKYVIYGSEMGGQCIIFVS